MFATEVQLVCLTVWFFAVLCTVGAGRRGMVYSVRLENTYQCPNHKNTTMYFKDLYVKRISSSETRLFGKMIIQADIEDIEFKMNMYKCASKSSPDTCEYYTGIHYDSLCDILKRKEEPWFNYFNSTSMPIGCPLPKGDWDIKGTKIGLTTSFPLFNGFWKMRVKGFNKKKIVACFFKEITIVPHYGR